MSNMSYCRFENTNSDVEDCFDAINNGVISSKSERKFAKEILRNMVAFLEENDIVDSHENTLLRINEIIDEIPNDEVEDD
jgi:hypothetical protein